MAQDIGDVLRDGQRPATAWQVCGGTGRDPPARPSGKASTLKAPRMFTVKLSLERTVERCTVPYKDGADR